MKMYTSEQVKRKQNKILSYVPHEIRPSIEKDQKERMGPRRRIFPVTGHEQIY